ncbi:hypothetical protein D8S78_22850 [Natrialba swarupiae]|nr:hypothetical protein [Natrialba swarupiae]
MSIPEWDYTGTVVIDFELCRLTVSVFYHIKQRVGRYSIPLEKPGTLPISGEIGRRINSIDNTSIRMLMKY